MTEITVYYKPTCPYCQRAMALLKSKKVSYTGIDIAANPEKREQMIALTGGTTVPQIIINGSPIGGCDDLVALDQSGLLDTLLSKEASA